MYAVDLPGHRWISGSATGKADDARIAVETVKSRRSMLIKFTHGLGDAAQLTCVLQHFAKYLPDHDIDVAALIGKHSCFHGLCRRVYVLDREPIDESRYDGVRDLGWYENYSANPGTPHTKVCNCLREDFGLPIDADLLRYRIAVRQEARKRAEDYLQSIAGDADSSGRFPVVLIHYEGNTSQDKKNLSHDTAKSICDFVRGAGYIPVILDWDRRCPFIDNRQIFCPAVSQGDIWGSTGTGDAESLASLIGQCALMIGVDSGPLHVAGATDTPTIGIWTEHSPLQFFDLCPNVLHLVPDSWKEISPCHVPGNAEYFEKAYRFATYSPSKIVTAICHQIENALPRRMLPVAEVRSHPEDLIEHHGFKVRRENIDQDLVIVRDVYQEDCYKLGIIRSRIEQARVVVDVGAHIGCFARKVHEMNPQATIVCVEACPENLPALRENVGHFATIIHAACTYESSVGLWNVYYPNCRSTGGSTVVNAGMQPSDSQYRLEERPLDTITLEQILEQIGESQIDLLKLDCEGSEFSILGKSLSLDRIGFVVGEYHGRQRWEQLLRDRCQGWDYGKMSEAGDLGNFHLRNPACKT